MENRKVIKIGGSNLKRIEDILKIPGIVTNYKKAPIVVVSAFYGITNKLISILDKITTDNKQIDYFIGELSEIKQAYIIELIDNGELRAITWNMVKHLLEELSGHLHKIKDTATVSPDIKDQVLSYGERMSSAVIWGTISCYHKRCSLAFPEDIGLITDHVIGNASVDLKLSKENLSHYFSDDVIYIVPGFYGLSENGQIRLLGRGGTDYSAAAIAYCINASSLDIWKDVDGFMTGDPKHVENPNQISHLSYMEAAELAYFGAGILHPRTVEPLQLNNIPIRIFNIYKDNAESKPQTIIDEKFSVCTKVIKSLTFENQIGIVSIKGPGVGYIPGILSEITKVLSENDINISSVITSQISINLLIKTCQIDTARQLIDSLNIHAITNLSVNKEVSLIAVVGNGMTSEPGIAAKVFSAIASEGINVLLSSLGASEVVTYFMVHKKDREKAISKLHEALFTEQILGMHSYTHQD